MSSQAEIRKVAAYAAAGGVAALVDVGGFVILLQFSGHPIASNAVSFICAAIVNYFLSSLFVFRAPLSAARLIYFICLATIGFVINLSVTVGLLRGIDAIPIIAKVCGVGVAFAFNYTMNRFLIFSSLGGGKV